MTHYAIIAWDAPGSEAARASKRAEHFARVERIMDRLAIAGPLRDADGRFTGSLVIVEADSEADARSVLEADPYYAAGVWDRFEIRSFLPAAGGWIGGKAW